uniref:poly(A)-specific ribonuclease n=1 Tax=Phascolarctos cinereus TaxID=38626 RepID=A0A6P5JGQ6_PHACI|nr:CCR4-NOT transcription complex subunit 8 isoform X3 [Phascolarctos cinereus]
MQEEKGGVGECSHFRCQGNAASGSRLGWRCFPWLARTPHPRSVNWGAAKTAAGSELQLSGLSCHPVLAEGVFSGFFRMPAALVENDRVICEVWASNLEEEMRKIREIVLSYSYIAMDTEFPGVVVRPVGEFRSSIDYQYQLLRCNVDLLKIIQLGLTFTNEKGEYPSGINTWQFNFKFNLIGYDFGYMVKLLTDSRLPAEEHQFFHILNLFFPSIYDVKYLMKSCKNLKGGLQEVADQLDLQRIGRQHQAGSDSLLTGMAFFRMKELFFEDSIDDAKYCGRLYGLGTGVAQKQNEDVESAQEKTSTLAVINNMQQ